MHRLDARLKLIASLVFVVCVIVTPMGWWTALGIEGLTLAFVVGLAGIPPRELGRRLLAFFVLFGFFTFMIAPAHPSEPDMVSGSWRRRF